MNHRSVKWADFVGAVWVVLVTVVFVGLPVGLPETGVWALEKVYALALMGGIVWSARRATAASSTQKGAKGRD